MNDQLNTEEYNRKYNEFERIIRVGNSLKFKSLILSIRFVSGFGCIIAVILALMLSIKTPEKDQYFREIITIKKLVTEPEEFKRYVVLVAGKDKDKYASRSDTLMTVFVDAAEQKVDIVSIPRDTRVFVKDRHRKINSAFRKGGISLTREVVSEYLGVNIDKYVCIDVAGFVKCIDIIGGVEVDVEHDMKYTDKAQGLYIDLKKGVQTLNGEQSMHYVRYREKIYGDIGRIKRQQKFLKLLSKKLKQFSIVWKVKAILSQIYNNVETDYTVSELIMLASRFRSVKRSNVHFHTLPGKPGYVDKISYFLADALKTKQLITRLYGKQTHPARLFETAEIDRHDKVVSLQQTDTREVMINDTQELSVHKKDEPDKDSSEVIIADTGSSQHEKRSTENISNDSIEIVIEQIPAPQQTDNDDTEETLFIDLHSTSSTEEIIIMR